MGGRYASQVQSWGGITILQALLGEKKQEEEEEEEEEVVDEEEEEGREEKVGMEEVCGQLLQHVIEQAENFSGVRTNCSREGGREERREGGREGGRGGNIALLASHSPPFSFPPSSLLSSGIPLRVRSSHSFLVHRGASWRCHPRS